LSPTSHTHRHRRFSIPLFAVLVALQVGLLFAGYRVLLPGLWERQLAGGAGAFIAVFVAMHLFLCFFEWFFHRYVLHGVTMRWLRSLATEHRHHHGLTPIRLRPVVEGSDRFVLNEYPITHEAQFESSAFPAYALVAFWIWFTPLLVVSQLLLPRFPVMLAGYAAIAWSLLSYEILHAIAHWPYEWWRNATEHPRWGGFWRRLYGFHHMHHANVGCNESIGGFFGLPLADWCFGTHHQPRELLLEGRKATAKDFAVRRPRAVVRWMDGWSRRRESGIVRDSASRAPRQTRSATHHRSFDVADRVLDENAPRD
jgi:hemolysin III